MKNMKNLYLIGAIAVVLVGGASFYGGMQYQKSQGGASGAGQTAFGGGPGGRVRGAGGPGGGIGGRNGGGFVGGEVLSKDDKSITIKMRDGGSKIVFYTTSTTAEKFVTGAMSDIVVGQQVSVNGAANPDGSVTAQSIQVRPNMPQGAQGGASATK